MSFHPVILVNSINNAIFVDIYPDLFYGNNSGFQEWNVFGI